MSAAITSNTSNIAVNSLAVSGAQFNQNNTMQCIANKDQALPANSLTTVASFSGASGILKRVWLALNGPNPTSCFFRITFDGAAAPQFGTSQTSGATTSNAIGCDVAFTAGFGQASYWANAQCGSNTLTSTAMGGYFAYDMPFSNSFTIQVYNNTSTAGAFWCQALYQLTSLSVPYYFYAKPYAYTNTTITATTFVECPLLSISSASNINGVILKTVKCLINGSGGGGSWVEGKFRGYTGGSGMTVGTPQSFTPGANLTASWYTLNNTGVTTIFSSSGTEDFFLNSYSFTGLTTYNSQASGVVLNTAGGVSGDITAYRNFFDNFDGCIGAPASTQFVFTWTDGDQNTPPSGSQTLSSNSGYVGYYA